MITEKQLQEAIAECQGERNAGANTCIKLAAYYTILDHLNASGGQSFTQGYSFEQKDGTEFWEVLQKVNITEALRVIDELMETLRIMQPKLYTAFMRKLTALK